MKIYFAGSITGGRGDADLYAQIIDYLQNFGEVLTEHIGEASLGENGEIDKTPTYVHDRDMAWVMTSDVVIAEVTTPSLGVGYEIGRAVENDKKILCLFRPSSGKFLSKMISGSKGVSVQEYSDLVEVKKILDEFLV